MRMLIGALALLGLAACGADAPPFTPAASVGISAGTGGVATSTTIGGSSGNFGIGATIGGRVR
jgi:hypothetical protein